MNSWVQEEKYNGSKSEEVGIRYRGHVGRQRRHFAGEVVVKLLWSCVSSLLRSLIYSLSREAMSVFDP